MPPWLPKGGPRLLGERGLTEEQIATIGRWVREGMAEGDPRELPAVPAAADGWQLGPPDLILTMEKPFVVPPGGQEVFRNFVIPSSIGRTRYIEAAELKPTNHRVLHHAMIMVDRTAAARQLDEADPEPGFESMASIGNATMPEGFFLGWTPGRLPFRGRHGLAWRLDQGDDIVLQFHLRPTDQQEEISARVGLYFADRAPTRQATVLKLGSETIDIPAGVTDHLVTDEYVLPIDVEVLGLYPHAHYLARDIKAVAIRPDGTEQLLLHIPEWDFNWQDVYRFVDPVPLTRGTTLVMRYTYDNSSANPRNPHQPPKRVLYGPHSVDEMGDLWIQVLPGGARDLVILQRDFTRKTLRRRIDGFEQNLAVDPAHPTAHGDIANTLMMLGEIEPAITHYRLQLKTNPADGNAHYNLGSALQSRGELNDAIVHYREALRLIPTHASAHNNLGMALQTLGQLEDALHHYRTALSLDSSYADAHNNLGVALLLVGRTAEGIGHLRQAARYRPRWTVPLATLAWVLATHPDNSIRDPAEARWIAERAISLGGEDPELLNTLAAAYAAAGAFEQAVLTIENAIALATAAGDTELVQEMRELEAMYRRREAYREQ